MAGSSTSGPHRTVLAVRLQGGRRLAGYLCDWRLSLWSCEGDVGQGRSLGRSPDRAVRVDQETNIKVAGETSSFTFKNYVEGVVRCGVRARRRR